MILDKFHISNGKAVLIGDSAHPFPPVGIGATIAAQGALNFVNKLRLYVNTPLAMQKYS